MKLLIHHIRQHIPMVIGASLLLLVVDGFILIYRLSGLSRAAAVYAGLLTFVLLGSLLARRIFSLHLPIQSKEDPMPKKQLLPPSDHANKREVSVNLRFSQEDYERLKRVADFSSTTIANLLFYVTINTTLPMMEQAVKRAQSDPSPDAQSEPPSQGEVEPIEAQS